MTPSTTSDEPEEEPSFDTYNTRLYLFDDMDRRSAEDLLRVSNVGTFLIRRSQTKADSYSLSLRISLEDENSIRHYIIEQRQQPGSTNTVYHMNGTDYFDLPTLVTHHTINQLGSSKNSTYLKQPAPKQVIEKVKCTYKFFGERATDLAFNFGERLDILEKPEEEWWIARNAMGDVGFVPANYVERDEEEEEDEYYQFDNSTKNDDEKETPQDISSLVSVKEISF